MRKNFVAKLTLSASLLTLTIVPMTYNSILTTFSAQAATTVPTFTDAQAVTYSIDLKNGTATASSYAGTSGVELVIPDLISYAGADYPVVAIGASAFLNAGISSVVIGDNVTDIGTSAFQTTTAFPAFYKTALKSVTLGKNVQNIKTDAFAGNAISQIQFPVALTKIGTRAFANNFLTNISFGANVTDIASKAFQTNNLSTITFAVDSAAVVGSLAFSGSPIEKISLGAGVVWTDDALNKISPLFGQLTDMPTSGVRIIVESQGVVKKSWLDEIPLTVETDNSRPAEENISKQVELPTEKPELKIDDTNLADLSVSKDLEEKVELPTDNETSNEAAQSSSLEETSEKEKLEVNTANETKNEKLEETVQPPVLEEEPQKEDLAEIGEKNEEKNNTSLEDFEEITQPSVSEKLVQEKELSASKANEVKDEKDLSASQETGQTSSLEEANAAKNKTVPETKADENTNALEEKRNKLLLTELKKPTENRHVDSKVQPFLSEKISSSKTLPALGEKTVSILLLAVTMLVGISIGYLLPKIRK